MHRIAATPGGWNPDSQGVIFVQQTPAPLVLLTAADTDIQTLAACLPHLPQEFPALRAVNLLQLQQHLSIDTYAETVLSQAQVIILRLLGGRSYWSYGLEVIKQTSEATRATLFTLPGDDRPDPDLASHSTVSLALVNRLWRYFTEGGVENLTNALKFVSDVCLETAYNPPAPKAVPRVGIYAWGQGEKEQETGDREKDVTFKIKPTNLQPATPPQVAILFYRSHYLAGNTLPIDALCQALAQRNLEPVPVFVSSLREPDVREELLVFHKDRHIHLLLNTTSFSLAKTDTPAEKSGFWQQLNLPVLQVILSSSPVEAWETSFAGLTPRDVAMNVALPEVDGRIITRAVSFKSVQTWNADLETDVVVYQPIADRINFVADLAANWIRLQQTPPQNRKIALILANYPNRDGRIANGVGLDTPASCIEILKALQAADYWVEDIPANGDELISRLTQGVTNDPEGQAARRVEHTLSAQAYQNYFATLPKKVQKEISDRWGKWEQGDGETGRRGDGEMGGWGDLREDTLQYQPSTFNRPTSNPSEPSTFNIPTCNPLEPSTFNRPTSNPTEPPTPFPISGIQLGNIFVGIQPSRGYDRDPSLNYHAPDLEPTHQYLAYYYWLKAQFGALAIVHVGKHGNLEWLPGKSVALSEACYPEVALGSIPHLYPFIVNDPGEGSQAKRRAGAVIIDHLTPPMTRAELYGPLEQLEALIDEYYEAQTLDPSRLKIIGDRILELVAHSNLDKDLGIKLDNLNEFLTLADGYLCELKEAQIRDGLHVFGQCPSGEQLRDLIIAIARSPSRDHLGITRALAQDLDLDFDPLTANPSKPFSPPKSPSSLTIIQRCRTLADAIEALEAIAAEVVQTLIFNAHCPLFIAHCSNTQQELHWIETTLLPSLQQTDREIENLLAGLDGKYIPSAPAGAPTRGRPDVLPTGRNFYSVDIRAIPTETAWDVGSKAAEAVIERYTQENGEYPKNLAISIWGTSTMRTGGDDVAQVLALLGVRPVWDRPSRRVVDFEILAPSVLGRPRIDVTVRVSGFFRDSFPNLLELLYQVTSTVASLNEDSEINPLATQVQQETQFWEAQGLEPEQAKERASYRVFGSKPGAYGAGLQGLIEAQNWTDDADLARAYINWSAYAYGAGGKADSTPEVFKQRLKQLQLVLHNQDNREHDLLDSDDYYQFQGGLTAAVRAISGKNPQTYFGDNSIPAHPKVRKLQAEIARVYRSRVINPKWIKGVMRHGYKGAFEMAATVDYLFAYDATARCVEDYMYQGVAETYLFDSHVQNFVKEKNPWALRDMAERLLEAHQRGLWTSTSRKTLDELREIVHYAEGDIEARTDL